MAELIIEAPNEKQKLFLSDTHKYIGFGGARGGGKSWVVRVKSILLALTFPGIKIMIVRRTYPELRENHIKPMRAMLHDIAKYTDTNKEFSFPNRSTILFRYCNCEKDLNNFQGLEIDVLFLDEATQLLEEWYNILKACVRGVNDFPKRIYVTCNPGGVGHQWVKRLFVDKKYKDTEDGREYSFIQSLVTDNKALMKSQPEYYKQLLSLPPKLRKAWLDGNWDIFEGQFFEEFTDDEAHYGDRIYTHVIRPFEVPNDWMIYRSFDFGYAKPFSCAWWAVDYDGVAYRILELYGCTQTPNEGVKWTPEKIFSEIHKVETEHRWLRGKTIYGVADPSIWDASRGESVYETACKHGVFFEKGDNERLPGWMQIHYRLSFDKNGMPMMYIFSNCKAFIRTIPLLQYDKHRVEDLDTTQEDHVADEVRYFCMARPMRPVKAAVEKILGDDPLNIDEYKFGPSSPKPKMIVVSEEEN